MAFKIYFLAQFYELSKTEKSRPVCVGLWQVAQKGQIIHTCQNSNRELNKWEKIDS